MALINMEYPYIIEEYQDISGLWQVRVAISDTESTFFQFQDQPQDADVLTLANQYIANENNQNEKSQEEQQIEQLEQDIEQIQNNINNNA